MQIWSLNARTVAVCPALFSGFFSWRVSERYSTGSVKFGFILNEMKVAVRRGCSSRLDCTVYIFSDRSATSAKYVCVIRENVCYVLNYLL